MARARIGEAGPRSGRSGDEVATVRLCLESLLLIHLNMPIYSLIRNVQLISLPPSLFRLLSAGRAAHTALSGGGEDGEAPKMKSGS